MSVPLTNEQFQQLLSTVASNMNANSTQPQPLATAVQKDPAALGPFRKCNLGSNKMAQLRIFDEWLEEAQSRMDYIGVTEDKDKVTLLKNWGGSELTEFMRTSAKAKLEVKGEEDADQYDEIVRKTREEMKRLVNRTLAMHNLLTTKQGSRSWMEFIKDLEDKAYLLDFDNKPYRQEDAVKDAAIFGMSDSRLKEKALTDDPQLKDLIRWGQARESGKEGIHNLKDGTKYVQRVNDIENLSDCDEIDDLIESLQVMKLRKAGKFSGRKQKGKTQNQQSPCINCSSDHPPNRCPANGKECFTCGGRIHFSNSKACKQPKDIKYMEAEYESSSSDEEDNYAQSAMAGVSKIRQWPGIQSPQTANLSRISA